MALQIETFVNPGQGAAPGGRTLFKALGHPLAADAAPAWHARLAKAKRLAVYDPLGFAEVVDQFYPLAPHAAAVYVQRLEDLGRPLLGRQPRPVDTLAGDHDLLLVAAFGADRLHAQIAHLLPAGTEVVTLDPLRLPDALLSDARDYLAPINFATNFALFRDEPGQHTRVVGANYWSLYGAERPRLWLRLFDSEGAALASWEQDLPPAGGSVTLDSREVRKRFGLGDFCGSLFIHAVRVKGHEVVKYALDTFGDDGGTLSCSHDANAWPAQYYAGLPAPRPNERVLLWVQNSHPVPIPAGAVRFNEMGRDDGAVAFEAEIPPFATRAIDAGALLPDLRWPAQIEIDAGKHFVRPRYEIRRGNGRQRIAHANVERTDLAPNPRIAELMPHLGKGYIMPLPVLPVADFASIALPTPMARSQADLPLKALLVDAEGTQVAERFLGRLPRHALPEVDVDDWLERENLTLPSGYGHMELVYDFRDGGEADGWLHALGRYEQRRTGHGADTSFGSHMFNMPVTLGGEPQSYSGPPPGLSTRLFLRVGEGADTFCHLVYPASKTWHPTSTTELRLIDANGAQVATAPLAIPCGGSRFWRVSEVFDAPTLAKAGPGRYVQIRDATCRLFGYHGLIRDGEAFSLDHMFGF